MDNDEIHLLNLQLKGIVGNDHWGRGGNIQPLTFNFIGFPIASSKSFGNEEEGEEEFGGGQVGAFKRSDDIGDTVSYSVVAKKFEEVLLGKEGGFKDLLEIGSEIVFSCLKQLPGLAKVTLKVEKSHALLHAKSTGIQITRSLANLDEESYSSSCTAVSSFQDIYFINDLLLSCIIGVNACERCEKQRVLVNIQFYKSSSQSPFVLVEDIIVKMANAISEFISNSSYKTLEAMAVDACELLLQTCNIEKLSLSIDKPSAVMFADYAGVKITRSRRPSVVEIGKEADTPSAIFAFLGIGGNLGDRLKNIKEAISQLSFDSIKVLDTSFLYETAPMYVLDQPKFLNAVLKVETSHSPERLLEILKNIEGKLGRDFSGIRNGARPIDLDILLYSNLVMETPTLTIPHPRIHERLFVLQPLKDVAPEMFHPKLLRTFEQLSTLLKVTSAEEDQIQVVFPIRDQLWNFKSRTFMMGILNVTPDSFSDGGQSFGVESALVNALQMIKDGADIIDIGGQSTAPNCPEITAEEEIDRVVPIIKAIRKVNNTIPISIDTFRASVAEAAIAAGADLINDVSGGGRDENMLKVMSSSQVPTCLMHMRGDSKTMQSMNEYLKDDVIGEMQQELSGSIQNAINAGVFRWNILIDPGIGFAKVGKQNYEIIRNLSKLTSGKSILRNMPILVGLSRKRFIGDTISQPVASKRVIGTAAATSASIMAGASIIRVHDIKEMKEVCLVTDEIAKRIV